MLTSIKTHWSLYQESALGFALHNTRLEGGNLLPADIAFIRQLYSQHNQDSEVFAAFTQHICQRYAVSRQPIEQTHNNLYPGTWTLINYFNIREADTLQYLENKWVVLKETLLQCVPIGNFGRAHLFALHRYLFEDLYPWAGELRTLNLPKSTQARSIFLDHHQLARQLKESMQILPREYEPMDQATLLEVISNFLANYHLIHPFREGNGRCGRLFIKQFAESQGFHFKLDHIHTLDWFDALEQSHHGILSPLCRLLKHSLQPFNSDEIHTLLELYLTQRQYPTEDMLYPLQQQPIRHPFLTQALQDLHAQANNPFTSDTGYHQLNRSIIAIEKRLNC